MTICSETRQLKDTVLNLQAATGVTDQTNYGNDGTYVGSDIATDTNATDGFVFNGTDDHVLGPDNADLEPADLTISFWFKPNDTGVSNQVILLKTHPTSARGHYWLWQDNGAASRINVFLGSHTSWDNVITTTVFNVGQWYHVALTSPDGGTARIYIDGVEDSSTALSGSINWLDADGLNLGYDSRPAQLNKFFNGSLKDVRIISRVITATEIRELYNAIARPDITGTVLHLRPQTGLVDQSGTQDPGSYVGNAVVVGRRFELDGAASYITNSLATSALTQFTMSAWVRPTGSNINQGVMQKGLTSNFGDFEMHRRSTGKWAFICNNNSPSNILESTSSIAVDEWAHLCCTYDGTTKRLYLNGTEEASAAFTGPITDTAADVIIGAYNSFQDFIGDIGECLLIDAAITAAQVLTLYEGVPGFEPALPTRQIADTVLHLQANHGERDLSNHCNYGTFTGTNIEDDSTDDEFVFNGTDDYIDHGDNASLSITGDLSVFQWINSTDGQSTTQVLSGKWDSTGSNERSWLFRQETTGKLSVFISSAGTSSSNHEDTSAAVLPNGQTGWYHVGFVYDATAQTVTIYSNGVAVASATSGTIPASIFDSVARMLVGAQDTGAGITGPYDGSMDDIRIKSGALSAAEVSLLFNKGVPRYQPFGLLGGEVLALEMSRHDVGVLNGTVLQLDGSTGVIDQSPAGNDGSLEGSVVVTDGKYVFDGVDGYLNIPDASSLTLTSGFTIAMWINAASGALHIIGKSASLSSGEFYVMLSSSDLFFRVVDDSTGGYLGIRRTLNFTFNKWQHCVFTYNGGTAYTDLKMYVDGSASSVVDASFGSFTAIENTTDALTVGRIGAGTEFDGEMDDIRILNRVLTATEVTTLYNNDISDDSGNGNNGTLTNGAYVGESDEIVFDAVNDEVSIPSGTASEFGTGPFAVSFWINVTNADYHGNIMTNGAWRVRLTSGLLKFKAPTSEISIPGSITDDGWHHVVFMRTAAGHRYYWIDGAGSWSGSVDLATVNTGTPLIIGGTDYLSMELRDIRIFNRELTTEDTEALFLASAYEVEVPNTKGTVLAVVPSFDDWGNATLNAIDFSGNGNVGTLTNMTTGDWVADTDSGGTRALDFDGVDDHVVISDSASLSPLKAITVACWINPDTTPLNGWAFVRKSNTYTLDITSGDKVRFLIWKAAGGTQGVIETVASGVTSWSMLVGTFDGTTLSLYLDGVEAATPVLVTATLPDTSDDLWLARGFSAYTDGLIDDAYLWDRVLSLDEIKALASTRNYFDCPIVSSAIIQTQRRRLSLSGGML